MITSVHTLFALAAAIPAVAAALHAGAPSFQTKADLDHARWEYTSLENVTVVPWAPCNKCNTSCSSGLDGGLRCFNESTSVTGWEGPQNISTDIVEFMAALIRMEANSTAPFSEGVLAIYPNSTDLTYSGCPNYINLLSVMPMISGENGTIVNDNRTINLLISSDDPTSTTVILAEDIARALDGGVPEHFNLDLAPGPFITDCGTAGGARDVVPNLMNPLYSSDLYQNGNFTPYGLTIKIINLPGK